jgi:hypothetical protein
MGLWEGEREAAETTYRILAGLGPLTVQNKPADFIGCQENLIEERAACTVKQIFHVKKGNYN